MLLDFELVTARLLCYGCYLLDLWFYSVAVGVLRRFASGFGLLFVGLWFALMLTLGFMLIYCFY